MIGTNGMMSPAWTFAGWTMLHFLWAGGVLAALAALGRWILRAAHPDVRHGYALASLVSLTLLPGFIGWMVAPESLAIEPPPLLATDRSRAMPLTVPPPAALADSWGGGRVIAQDPHDESTPVRSGTAPVASPKIPRQWLDGVAAALPAVWLVGAPLTFAYLAAGLAGAERLRRRSAPAGELAATCRRLASALRVSRSVAVGVCDRISAPILLGVFRPMILLPSAALTGWSSELVELAMLHELAHVRRLDNAINLFQRLVESTLFFHPAVWWVSGWVRREREHCCDRIVVEHTGQALAYAETLYALSQTGPAGPLLRLPMAESYLVTRIRRILSPEDRSMKLSRSAVALAGVLLLLPVVLLRCFAQPPGSPAALAQAEAPKRADPPRQNDPAPGTVSGRVVNPDGQPVEAARVWIDTETDDPESYHVVVEARTDAAGRFRLVPANSSSRAYRGLFVDASGFALLSVLDRDHLRSRLRASELGDLQVVPGRVFTGRVLDVDGKPRPGAAVLATVNRRITASTVTDIGPVAPVMTDADGRFRTPPLPVGFLALSARAPGRQLARAGSGIPIRPDGEEELPPIRLEADVPVSGVVQDEQGTPIAGARIGGTIGHTATSDAEGRFTLHGFGPNPTFQMNVEKDGYDLLTARVTGTDAGLQYAPFRGDSPPTKPARELTVILKRWGLIEGQVVDANSGAPVRLSLVAVLTIERKPGGEVVLPVIARRIFEEQTEVGRFRAFYPEPGEYCLAFGAAGYQKAEVLIPKITELKTIGGLIVRMTKNPPGAPPAIAPDPIARQTISGTVTRGGQPVRAGSVRLWTRSFPSRASMAPIMRGRLVENGPPTTQPISPIREGAYLLKVPSAREDWYVVAEESGHVLTQVGPIAVTLNETKHFDIACTEGGRIQGRVKGVPEGWEGHVWVVAFSRTAVREEARAAPDGTFSFLLLPPGEYGLKAGHDAYRDPEVFSPGGVPLNRSEARKQMADPWKQAKVVRVEAGRDTAGVEVPMPQ